MNRTIKQRLIDQILKLEQLFHSRYLTVDLLNELISSYVQVIECFDGSHAPMRKYFLNKIQFIVSRPEINSMLQRANNTSPVTDIIRQTVRYTNANTSLEQGYTQQMLMQVIESDHKKKKNMNNTTKNTSQQKVAIQKMEQQKFKDRHLKIQMQMKVMREIQENMKNLQDEYKNEDQKNTKAKKRINALMQQQNNSLQNRLAMRRKKKKKSIDQKQIKQRQQIEPIVKKEQLKQAQKQIQQAVMRMTIRMTLRASQNNRNMTGLLGNNENKNLNTKNQEKSKGRVKIRNQVKEESDQEDLNLLEKKVEKREDTNRVTNLTSGTEGGKGRVTMRKQNNFQDQEELM